MARKTTKVETDTKEKEPETVIAEEVKELDLDKKVTVRNIGPWDIGFRAITEARDIQITKNGTVRLSNNEIISQCNNNNKLFTGIDGLGGHASIMIEDKLTRKELGFETPENPQKVFSEDKIKELFNISNDAKFENEFKETIVTRAEKAAAMLTMSKLGINDYRRIKFCEAYTGMKLE